MTTGERARRNPGPSWGYRFLTLLDQLLPYVVMRELLRFGTLFALPLMPAQRHASREYLSILQGKPVSLRRIHRHFTAFTFSLWAKLRTGRGIAHSFRLGSGSATAHFETFARSGEPALFGTMHIGNSDLMGCYLSDFDRRISMVRLKVANSHDIEQLSARFAGAVDFIWVNRPDELLFALKRALDEGASLALQCDRIEHSTRREIFSFLGQRRPFPFTIYHLAFFYRRPVVFSFGLAAGRDRTEVHHSRILRIGENESKSDYLARARDHFQEVLELVESLLQEAPDQWFNFEPLNPEVSA